MCSPATCYSCGKATFAGCGMHVEAVLGHVPAEARCTCHEQVQAPAPEPRTSRSAFGW